METEKAELPKNIMSEGPQVSETSSQTPIEVPPKLQQAVGLLSDYLENPTSGSASRPTSRPTSGPTSKLEIQSHFKDVHQKLDQILEKLNGQPQKLTYVQVAQNLQNKT